MTRKSQEQVVNARHRDFFFTKKTLGKINKVIIEKDAGGSIVPYLPLPEIKKRTLKSEQKINEVNN